METPSYASRHCHGRIGRIGAGMDVELVVEKETYAKDPEVSVADVGIESVLASSGDDEDTEKANEHSML